MDDICVRAQVGRATFFRFYGTKAGLLAEFNRRLAELARTAVADGSLTGGARWELPLSPAEGRESLPRSLPGTGIIPNGAACYGPVPAPALAALGDGEVGRVRLPRRALYKPGIRLYVDGMPGGGGHH